MCILMYIRPVTVGCLTKSTNAYMVPKNQKISKAWMLGDFFFFLSPMAFGCH